jgi:hypothetical protein
VLDVVDITVGEWRDEPDGVTGTLTLARRGGGEPVTASRLGRSVVIQPTVQELPLLLGRDAASVSTGLSFAPASCDAHVLAETSSRTCSSWASRSGTRTRSRSTCRWTSRTRTRSRRWSTGSAAERGREPGRPGLPGGTGAGPGSRSERWLER